MNDASRATSDSLGEYLRGCCATLAGIKTVPAFAAI
jgi:hypothetical protein